MRTTDQIIEQDTAIPQRTQSPILGILALLLRVAVGLTLLVAGVGKLKDATAATAATEAAIGVSGTAAAVLAIGVSVLEIVLGVHLILGLNLRWSAAAASLLCAALLVIVIRIWVSGYTGGCGCFGIFGGGSAGWGETIRDSVLLLAAIGTWLTRRFGPALDRLSGK